MTDLIYHEIPKLNKEDIIKGVQSKNKDDVLDALLSIFTNEVDLNLAVKFAKEAVVSEDLDIKSTGILGVEYMVETYDEITEDIALEILKEANPITNDDHKDYVEYAKHMIKIRYHKKEKLNSEATIDKLLKLFLNILESKERKEKVLEIQEIISDSEELSDDFYDLSYKLVFYNKTYKDSELESDLTSFIAKYKK